MTEIVNSRQNPLIQELYRLSNSASERREKGLILCDGLKLLHDALSSGFLPKTVLAAPDLSLPELPQCTRLARAIPGLIEAVSSVQTPQGVLFTLPRPRFAPLLFPGGTYLLLDRVQDPGNVGAVIRSAEAFGLTAVILTEGCADPYSPKSLRAAMGSALRQRLFWAGPELIQRSGLPLWALDMKGQDIRTLEKTPGIAVLGNEGEGVSQEWRSLVTKTVRIPMSGKTESLNAAVAAAIMMWELGPVH